MAIPTTVRGATTYSGYVPNKWNTGDILTYSDKLRTDSPEIQSLKNQGLASDYADVGLVFTKPPVTPSGLPKLPTMPANMQSFLGSTTMTSKPTNYGNVSPAATYNQPNPVSEVVSKANYLATDEGKNVYNLLEKAKKAGDQATVTALNQAISNRVNMATYGWEQPQFQKGPLTSDLLAGQNLNPMGSGSGLAAGVTGGPGGIGGGSTTGGSQFNMSSMTGGTGLEEPPMNQYDYNVKGDYSGLSDMSTQITQQQQQVLDSEFASQMQSIQENFTAQKAATKLQGDQNLAGAISKINRGGGRNMAATASFEYGMGVQNQANIDALTKAQTAAEQAARIAYQTGNSEILTKAYDRVKEVQFQITEDLNNQWNQIREGIQVGVNEYQAKSSYILGAYGKMLEAQGMNLDTLKEQNSVSQFAETLKLDQAKFDEDVKQNGMDNAIAKAKLLGYYVDPTTNELMPTADGIKKMLGGGGNGKSSGTGYSSSTTGQSAYEGAMVGTGNKDQSTADNLTQYQATHLTTAQINKLPVSQKSAVNAYLKKQYGTGSDDLESALATYINSQK